jgi:ankyrin repeat protein
MTSSSSASARPAQRWARPLDVPPGFWKRQLPTKYLRLAARGDLPGLRQLLADQPDSLSHRGAHGRTLLWEAARRGRLQVVQWLLDHGADLDATGAYNNESHVQITPYCAAVFYRRPRVAACLRARDPQIDVFRAAFLGDVAEMRAQLAADPALLDAEDPCDAIYYMPLVAFAVAGGHLDATEFLLRRGARTGPYASRLGYLAAHAGRLDLLELLVAYGLDLSACDPWICVATRDLRVLRFLLTHGVSVTESATNGFPPLVYAARGDKRQSVEHIRLLLEHGAPVSAAGPDGRTALDHATAAGRTDMIDLLLEHGAVPRSIEDGGGTSDDGGSSGG